MSRAKRTQHDLSIRLYDLKWCEVGAAYEIRVPKEEALSLWRALDATDGTFGVTIERSKWIQASVGKESDDPA